MYLQQILTGLALLRLAAATQLAQTLTPRQVPTGPCSTGVHVIATGGRGTDNPFEYGLLGSLAESIVAAIPDSTRVSLPYDKLTTRTNSNAIPDGVATLNRYINDYNTACPDTKQVLLGYSSGAIITMNGICGGGVTADKNIIATIVYGDQTRQSGQPYNQGTCQASGRNPRVRDSCGAFTPNIQSYCNTADAECCGGGDPQEHFVYPSQFDAQATQFVRERFETAFGVGGQDGMVEVEPVRQPEVPSSSSASDVSTPTSSPATTLSARPVVERPTSEPAVPAPTSSRATTPTSAPVVETQNGEPSAEALGLQGVTDSMAQILLQEAENAGYADGCTSMSGAMKKLLIDEAERAGFVEAC